MRARSRGLKAALFLTAALALCPAAAPAYQTLVSYGHTVKWSADSSNMMVNTSGMPGGSLEAIKAAFATWNGAGAHFTINYGGSSASTSFGKNDGTNLIDYGKLDGMLYGGAGADSTIALCLYWYDPRTGNLLDADIRLNSSQPWSTSGDADAYDVQNIVTHELGHTLVLLDLYGKGDSESTLYGLAEKGETKKRTLEADDTNGIKALYP